MAQSSAPTPAAVEPSSGPVRVARAIETVVAVLAKLAIAAAGLLLLTILLLMAYSVLWRYFLNAPQPWVDEATAWLLVAAVMLAIPEVQRRNDHIGIDFLHQKLKGRPAARAVLVFGTLTVLVSSVVLVVEGISMVEFSRMLNVLSNQIPEVPLWAVQALVPVGFGLMALVAGVQLLCLALGIVPHAMRESLHEDLA